MDQHTATGHVPVHPEHAETRYALTAAGHAALTPAGDPPPPGVVVLCCTDCDRVYEPTAEDLAAGRAGCPDPDCGGWTFSSALTRQELAAAQVHATLALAAATAYPAVRDHWATNDSGTPRDWAEVAS